ncbi:hydroxymethylbilane synthase [Candidatus Glomeribacter gigasporarum]|uniref:hydroxymethylbilane synthase n=1 Tax=Candidatus Glomeribacter gigasporarum TaxID=132144 RepID=UPI00030747AD|nr:hydroxymethylbilane synthase [Candidatus Glomeribacter gigasporarum]
MDVWPLKNALVIASRKSPLALRQAEEVRAALQKLYPQSEISILGITTRGDQWLDQPLSKIGGKGLFIKELEQALADGRADLAVHSLKDMPAVLPAGFKLAAIPERADPRDAFVCHRYLSLDTLPAGSVVGTSSLRRAAMVRAHYPRLNVQPLRGNLDTRLRALDAGACTAMILAAAGLIRLGLEQRIRALLAPELSLPAASQGALGIEIREDRPEIADWLAPLNHLKTALAVYAERTVARALGGNCAIPLAAFAEWIEGILLLRACIAQPDGARFLRARACAAPNTLAEAETLGYTVADDLARQGAQEMVRAFSEQ